MLRGIFQTKNLDDILATAESGDSLKRELGAFSVTLLGIGAIIGAGIFATIGTAAAGDAARPGAGPSLMLSFAITAIVCAFTALCYAEFASMVPISGSAYTYSYATLGELVAWIIGWDLIIEYAVGNVAVAISWANYFRSLLEGFGIHVPLWLATDFRTGARLPGIAQHAPHLFGVPIVFNLLAFLIVAVITVVLVWGIRESAGFNAMMVGIKILVLALLHRRRLLLRVAAHHGGALAPFQPNGWRGTFAGAAIVFFAYIGFDAVSTVAEETKNPSRDLPIGIIASLVICTVFYMAVAAVFTGMIPYPVLVQRLATEQAEPLTMALNYVAPHAKWAAIFVALGLGHRPHRRAARLPARPAAHLLLDGPRRPAAAGLRARPPALQDAVRDDHPDRRPGGRGGGVRQHRRDGRPDQHRHPLRLRPGLRRDRHPAPPATPAARARSGCRSATGWCRSSAPARASSSCTTCRPPPGGGSSAG